MSIPPQAFQIFQESFRALKREIIDEALAEIRRRMSGSFTASGQVSAGALGGVVPTTSLPPLAGDVTGAPGTNVVAKIQGIQVSTTDPTTDQVMKFNGSAWAPGTDSLGTPASTVVTETAFGQVSAVGVGTPYARNDHTHGTPANPVTTHEAAGDPHAGYVLESLLNAKGDMIAASADNTPALVTVGGNGFGLVADNTQTPGVAWRVPNQVVLSLTNSSGASVALGDVVLVFQDVFETAASWGAQAFYVFSVAGVALETIADGAVGRICTAGRVPQINLSASASGFKYVGSSATTKLADLTGVIRAGVFGYVLGTGTTPPAILWGWPQQGRADQTVVSWYNGTGATLSRGTVVMQDTAFSGAVKKTTAAGFAAGFVGVMIEDAADGLEGLVCIGGICERVNLDASGSQGDLIKASGTAGQATAFTPIGAGAFGQLLNAGANPDAMIWNPPR